MGCDCIQREKLFNAFDYMNREIKQKSLIVDQISTTLTKKDNLDNFRRAQNVQ
jgi:hypothetical protein